MAPPTDPGIQAKNSNPVNKFSFAKLDNLLSKVAAPTSIMLSFSIL